jgi:hypothetical protein
VFGKPSRRKVKRLESHGVRAVAEVLEIGDRGITVTSGNQRAFSSTEVLLKTRLRVEPEGEPPFEVEKRFRYGQLSAPPVGMRVNVIFDPDNHGEVILDHSGSEGVPNNGALGGLLSSLQEAGAESRAASAPPAVDEDPVEQLTKLADLRDRGVLTDAEFAEQKARILSEQ